MGGIGRGPTRFVLAPESAKCPRLWDFYFVLKEPHPNQLPPLWQDLMRDFEGLQESRSPGPQDILQNEICPLGRTDDAMYQGSNLGLTRHAADGARDVSAQPLPNALWRRPRSSPCLADTTNHEKGAGDGRPVGYRLGAPSRGMEIVSCLERLWRQPARLGV